jgi:molecular chaperone DnaJ
VNGPNDLYVVLEVVRTASVNDIKKAFRKLARRYHPDINPGDRRAEEHFKMISEAYEILSDPSKREFYDRHGFYSEDVLDSRETSAAWGFSFKTFDFPNASVSSGGAPAGQFFMRQQSRRDPERGRDLEYQMSISFSDSIAGLTARISVQRRHSCSTCTGTGKSAAQPCKNCGGSVYVARVK